MTMKFLSLTLTTGETFLIRADLVLQIRPHEGGVSGMKKRQR
jgi:hypothetical protein